MSAKSLAALQRGSSACSSMKVAIREKFSGVCLASSVQSEFQTPCRVISIDGNIGSGKSTLLSLLKEHFQKNQQSGQQTLSVSVAPERTHEWKGMLPLYYEDTPRWSFPFQMQVLLSHIRNFKEANEQKADLLFVERSPLAAQLVFGQLLKEEGLITDVESELFDDFMTEVAWKPDAIVYLECTPKLCLERIMERSTTGEEGIPLDYLEKVSKAYKNFIAEYETKVPVIRIDSSKPSADLLEAIISDVSKLGLTP
mmetsp:Transcript_5724/g.10475  ORF Transcript_5724/g.10475 Transcript_5724/m.10475 type:complete len:255 (+) Transcript_5724:254-1018(+)